MLLAPAKRDFIGDDCELPAQQRRTSISFSQSEVRCLCPRPGTFVHLRHSPSASYLGHPFQLNKLTGRLLSLYLAVHVFDLQP